jgi:organic radical activating enzyme
MKGMVPLEELLYWYRSWNTKIRPQNVRIMGGEPLLHPHLETILHETRHHWTDSRIELITNGLLLPKMKPSLYETIKEVRAAVTVSKHFDDVHYNALLETGLQTLRCHGIRPNISKSHQRWMKCYRIDANGSVHPHHSDPEKAWKICYVKNRCTTLLNNQLYRCPQLGCFAHAAKQGFVPDDWQVVLDYKPLSPSCTQEELEAFMHAGWCEQCCVCPEEFQFADPYEIINLFGLPITRNIFCGGTNHEET